MNDSYICKAKRTDNGEWVEGFYFYMVHEDGSHVHHFIMPLGTDLSLKTPIEKIQVEIDPETICRSTGIPDKNGKMVYENDILLQKTNKNHWCQWERSGVVKFGNHDWRTGEYGFCTTGFYIEPIVKKGDETKINEGLSQEYFSDRDYPYEVIGNTFDNPELLEDMEIDIEEER